jgi:hypothetical protein
MPFARLLSASAVALGVVAVPSAASADPANGCSVASASSCTFVATGDVRYLAAGLAGCTFEVRRNYETVYRFSGNQPPTGVITAAEAGDTVRVYAGYAHSLAQQTRCGAWDAQ